MVEVEVAKDKQIHVGAAQYPRRRSRPSGIVRASF